MTEQKPKARKSKAATKPTTGRPTGSKTKARETVTQTVCRATCNKCGSTEHKDRRRIRGGTAGGRIDGQAYGSYTHYHANCSNCGQALLVAEYELI